MESLHKRDFKEAHQYLEKAMECVPNDVELAYLQGAMHVVQKHLSNPEKPYPYQNLSDEEVDMIGNAVRFHEEKQYTKAILELKNLLRIYPDSYMGYYGLGLMHKEIEKYEEALLFYDKCLELEPGYTCAIEERAQVQETLKHIG
jgi:tetratricopeptide (TPR) repeat protein